MNEITTTDALRLIRLLLSQAFEAPAAFARPPNPRTEDPGGTVTGAEDLALLLNAAGVTLPEAQAGLVAYINEGNPTQFKKPWPDSGMIIARIPRRTVPDEAVATYHALVECYSAMQGDCARLGLTEPVHYVKDRDTPEGARRERAIRAGVQALGGWRPFGAPSDPKSTPFRERDFAAAYRAEMHRLPDNVLQIPASPSAATTRRLAALPFVGDSDDPHAAARQRALDQVRRRDA